MWSERPPEERGRGFFDYLREHNPDAFAHHPNHPAFEGHCWRVGGLRLCRGCVMGAAGLLSGLVVGGITRWPGWLGDERTGLVFAGMLLPTVLTSVFGAPRPLKDAARFVLGFLTASAFVFLFVAETWLARGIVVAVYLVARGVLSKKRTGHHKAEIERFRDRQSVAKAAGA
ncbi:MAG: hypothetical protein AAF297_05305 [Planctomycetota bacterium]